MEISSFFNSKDGDRIYNATHWADYFKPLFNTGVFNGDLQVTANGGMSVRINKGYAWIDGYVYHLTEPLTLDMETASGNMNRIDNVVLRLDLTNRWIRCYIITGSYYQGQALAPAPEIGTTIHEIVIARISVAAGTTAITQDLITDTRMDDTLCGWVCGAVDQIKFEQIKAQFDAFFAKYEASIHTDYQNYTEAIRFYEAKQQADFEAWVESLKELLNDADAAVLKNELDQANDRIDQVNGRIDQAKEEIDRSIRKEDMIGSLAITEPGKVMDGATCAKYLLQALGTTLKATLAAGATTLTFTSAAITDDSLIDIYADTFGVCPSAVVQDGNTLTLTFDKQTQDIKVLVKVG